MRPRLILAEKPAVARDLARVLGVPQRRGATCFRGDRFVITWCIGHLIEIAEPAGQHPGWRPWSFEVLPMLPERFKLRPIRGTSRQWKAVRDLLASEEFIAVVNACDAGREGELIFQYCYELSGSRLPIERLWISSLTDEAVRAGFRGLRPAEEFRDLLAAARSRAEADWLVGMNATRAVTLRQRAGGRGVLSIGRVQTPTLALLVRREEQIRVFQPRAFHEVHAELEVVAGPGEDAGGQSRFRALYHHGGQSRIGPLEIAEQIAARSAQAAARGEGPHVLEISSRRQREPPPLLFDLTSLQRTANLRYGMSAKATLDAAQALYERHKLITYPRTDCRYLSSDLLGHLAETFAALTQHPVLAPFAARLVESPPRPPGRVFKDSHVREHHAIIPTRVPPHRERVAALAQRERQIHDLLVRRFLGAFYPDAELELTRVVVRVGGEAPRPAAEREMKTASDDTFLDELPPPPDDYLAHGKVVRVAGWREVAGIPDGASPPQRSRRDPPDEASPEQAAQPLPLLARGQLLSGGFRVVARQTRPPPRYSEATLLQAMESAGEHIEDEELRQQMKDVGLGTPATRASIIETLLKRGYVERQGQKLHPTALGVELIAQLPTPSLASPTLTGSWEARLSRIARGEESRAAFMADIARYVEDVVRAARPPAPGEVAPPDPRRAAPRVVPAAPVGRHDPQVTPRLDLSCPRCAAPLIIGTRGWGCAAWRGGCPFMIPFEVLGRRLSEAELRDLITEGASPPLRFHPLGGRSLTARLRLAPGGTPAGFFYLDMA